MDPAVDHRTRDRAIIVGVVFVLAALVVWYPTRPGVEHPALVQRNATVLDASFSMPRGSGGYYAAYPFVVPTGIFNAVLEVNFTVSGTGEQSYEVAAYVMNSSQLAEYQSGAAAESVSAMALANSLANSGLVLDLGASGTYYIVFTPLGSTGTGQPATVRALATLDYTGCATTC